MWEWARFDTMPVCRQVMDKAGEITGLDIPKICFTENEGDRYY